MPRGGKIDKRNFVVEPDSLKAWIAKGGEIDKRNVVFEPDSLKAWIAKGGGKIDKRNIILEPDSLKAWIAKGGEIDKWNVVLEHGLPRGGKLIINSVLFLVAGCTHASDCSSLATSCFSRLSFTACLNLSGR